MRRRYNRAYRQRLSRAHSHQAVKLRGRPRLNLEKKPLRITDILRLRSQFLTFPEIGKQLGCDQHGAWKKLRNVGLLRGFYSFGELLDSDAIRVLKTATRLSAEEFARLVHTGASRRTVNEYTRARHQHFEPKTAKEITEGRKKVIALLLQGAKAISTRTRIEDFISRTASEIQAPL